MSVVIIDTEGTELDRTNSWQLYPLEEGARWSEDYWPAGDRWPRWHGYEVAAAAWRPCDEDHEPTWSCTGEQHAVAWALLAPLEEEA